MAKPSLFAQQSKKAYVKDESMEARTNAAEADYEKRWGARDKIRVHLQIRFAERKYPGWGITPHRWPYIWKYPTNVSIFATVDEKLKVVWNGWMEHETIRQEAVPEKDTGTHTYRGALYSLPTFCP